MTFQEAKTKLKEIAAGRYHSIKYELTEYVGGRQEPECTVYIAGFEHNSGNTWEEAFESLARDMDQSPADVSEAPDFVEEGK